MRSSNCDSDSHAGADDAGARIGDSRGHSHEHSHGHAHNHGRGAGTGRLVAAIALNVVITAAEFAAGLMAGSLALLADAAHNLNDAASLGVSLGARLLSQKDPDRRRTFGYRRAEVIGAFVNLITLVLVALYLLKEAVERTMDPRPVDGTVMMVVAGIALAANVATAFLLAKQKDESLNIESAFVHIVADALASVGVLAAGALVLRYGWLWIDPLLTGILSIYILAQSARMLRRTVRILMDSAPPDFPFDEMVREMESVEGVLEVHHVHVWQLDEERTAVEAHVVIQRRDLEAMEEIKRTLKTRLRHAYTVGHTTLEFEFEPCMDAPTVVPGKKTPAST